MNFIGYFTNLNQSQRMVLGIAASLLVFTIFSHNPFSGYVTSLETTRSVSVQLNPCTEADKASHREFEQWFFSDESRHSGYEFQIKDAGGVDAFVNIRVANCHILKPGLYNVGRTVNQLQTEVIPLSLSEWRSKSPIFYWTGNILNLGFIVFSVLTIAAIFIGFVLRPTNS
jgi:hypothetical protein